MKRDAIWAAVYAAALVHGQPIPLRLHGRELARAQAGARLLADADQLERERQERQEAEYGRS